MNNLVKINLDGGNVAIRRQYLMLSKSLTVGGLMIRVRRLINNLRETEAIFIFLNGEFEPMSKQLREIQVGDNPIECLITVENTFG